MIAILQQASLVQWYYLLGIAAIIGGGMLFVWRKVVRPSYRYIRERMRRVTEAFDSVAAIRKEVFPNGGSSLRDAVNSTSHTVREMSRAVAMSIAQNRSLAEQMETGMFEGDANGLIVWANRSLRQVTGLRMEQIVGSGWVNAVHDDDRRRIENDWAMAMHNQRPFIAMFRFTHVGTGTSVPVHCEAYPIFASEDTTSGWLGLLRTREVEA